MIIADDPRATAIANLEIEWLQKLSTSPAIVTIYANMVSARHAAPELSKFGQETRLVV
jgi:hypothetical protein